MRIRTLFVLVMVMAMVIGSMSFAKYFRAPITSAKLNAVEVLTEEGKFRSLLDLVDSRRPILLIPGYYSCGSSCPMLAEKLRRVLSMSFAQRQFQVIFFSFNEHDNLVQMKRFREHHRIPPNWFLTVARFESQARSELQNYGYQFQKIGADYDHPNYLLVFSKSQKLWSGLITGNDLNKNDFVEAIRDARFSEEASFTHWLYAVLFRPEYWIIGGCVGILCSLTAIIATLSLNRKARD